MSLRFVHTADLHLDSPFLGLSASAPAHVAARLLSATFDAYDAIIDLCLDQSVEALLVAGDVYDGADRSLRAQRHFYRGLGRLSEAGIRSFVCHGNHDHLAGWEARLDAPPLCHRFGPEIEAVPFDPAHPERGTVYGISYPRRDVVENLAQRFRHERSAGPGIGLLHANVGANAAHPNYAPCSIADLVETGMDYWALGHIHTRAVLRERAPAIVYPGNPQGRDRQEPGPRGAYVVELDEDGTARLDFHELDAVRWATLDVSIAMAERDADLLERLQDAIAEASSVAAPRPLVFRLRLTGRGPLHATLRRKNYIADLQAQLNEEWSAKAPFAWCERVDNATAPLIDREELREGQDFVADLLRLSDGIAADDERLNALLTELETLYNRPSLQDAVPDPAALLAEAEALCIEALVGEPA